MATSGGWYVHLLVAVAGCKNYSDLYVVADARVSSSDRYLGAVAIVASKMYSVWCFV